MSDIRTGLARLVARTEEARRALGRAEVCIERFPFSLGRESRTTPVTMSADRRRGGSTQINDVYLKELARRHQASREHFRIDVSQGKYVLTDRGSVCGTTINGTTIGGHRRGGHIDLHDRDEVTVGDASSTLVFEFRVP